MKLRTWDTISSPKFVKKTLKNCSRGLPVLHCLAEVMQIDFTLVLFSVLCQHRPTESISRLTGIYL